MKFKLKKYSPNMYPIKEKIENYMANKTNHLFYNKKLGLWVGRTQKTIIVDLKVTLKD